LPAYLVFAEAVMALGDQFAEVLNAFADRVDLVISGAGSA
jgi:hypothetical protein